MFCVFSRNLAQENLSYRAEKLQFDGVNDGVSYQQGCHPRQGSHPILYYIAPLGLNGQCRMPSVELFPPWEPNAPTLGSKQSHVGTENEGCILITAQQLNGLIGQQIYRVIEQESRSSPMGGEWLLLFFYEWQLFKVLVKVALEKAVYEIESHVQNLLDNLH